MRFQWNPQFKLTCAWCMHADVLCMVGGYLSAFLSDSDSSFLGGAVFGIDLTVIDGVKKSSSSDIESNIPPTFLAKEKVTHTTFTLG